MARVLCVIDHGTIVQLFLDDSRVVSFDHRQFTNMAKSRGNSYITGQEVLYDGETLTFLDEVEDD